VREARPFAREIYRCGVEEISKVHYRLGALQIESENFLLRRYENRLQKQLYICAELSTQSVFSLNGNFYLRNELKLRNEMLIFTAEQSRIKSSQRGLPLGENSC
jgi:hypothetical protein